MSRSGSRRLPTGSGRPIFPIGKSRRDAAESRTSRSGDAPRTGSPAGPVGRRGGRRRAVRGGAGSREGDGPARQGARRAGRPRLRPADRTAGRRRGWRRAWGMTRALAVWWEDAVVGSLRVDRNGALRFAYDPDWLADPASPALSVSLPKRAGPFRARACQSLLRRAAARGRAARRDRGRLRRVAGQRVRTARAVGRRHGGRADPSAGG